MKTKKIIACITTISILFMGCNTITHVNAQQAFNEQEISNQQQMDRLFKQFTVMINGLVAENNKLKEENQSLQKIVDNINMTYIGDFNITYYCTEPYPHICGGGGRTASGCMVQPYVTAAVDTGLIPFGTVLYIEGEGIRIAQDTGGAINNNKIDLAVATHNEALQKGRRTAKVWILN